MAATSVIQIVLRVAQIIFCIICLASSAYSIDWLRKVWLGLLTLAPLNYALFSSLVGLLVSSLMLIGPMCNRQLAERLPGLMDIILSGLLSLFFLSSGGGLAALGGCTGTYASADAGLSTPATNDPKDWADEAQRRSDQMYQDSISYGASGGRRLLAVDAAAASGSRRALLAVEPVCAMWDLTIAMSFLCFVLYGVSTVLAGLDLKAGKGWLKPRGAASMPGAPPHYDYNMPASATAIPIKTAMVPPAPAAQHMGDNPYSAAAAEVNMVPQAPWPPRTG